MEFCSLADGAFIWSLKDWVETPGTAGETNTAVKFYRLTTRISLFILLALKNTFYNRHRFGPRSGSAVSAERLLPFWETFHNHFRKHFNQSMINVSLIRHKWRYCTRALLPLHAGRLAKCFGFLQQLNKSFKPRKDFLLSHGYYFQRVSDTLGLQHAKILIPECARNQRLEETNQFSGKGEIKYAKEFLIVPNRYRTALR